MAEKKRIAPKHTKNPEPLNDKRIRPDIYALVRDSFDLIEHQPNCLALIARRIMRIARIMGDHEMVFQTQLELWDFGEEAALNDFKTELENNLGRRAADAANSIIARHYDNRKYVAHAWKWPLKLEPQDCWDLGSLEELESELKHCGNLLNVPRKDASDSLVRLEYQNKERLYLQLLARIRLRFHNYLSQVERRLFLVGLQSDLLAQYKQIVDEALAHLAPEVLAQFTSIQRRVIEGDAEARSQAVSSCRRVLKALADYLFPPSSEIVKGRDGKMYPLDDKHYLLRFSEFVKRSGRGRSADLLQAQIGDVEARLSALNALASKGVHSPIGVLELNQCVIQTYALAADMLTLSKQN